MYLAEGEIALHTRPVRSADLIPDRILCWELVSKRNCKWTLHYVKSSYAITDVPDTVSRALLCVSSGANGISGSRARVAKKKVSA
jgi:hypothetical protein